MYIKFWGTRGSLPRATDNDELATLVERLAKEARKRGITAVDDMVGALRAGTLEGPITYGGNTSCTEVGHGDRSFFIDMGSGLRDAGTFAITQGQRDFHIFMTHMHWDHIMGMPFFTPVHSPKCRVTIYHVHKNAPEFIKINFNGVNFPLKWDQLAAEITFKELKLYDKQVFGDISATAFALDHPGGSFGYRFEANGKSLAIGVDGEYKRLTPEELGKDLRFFQSLDLLSFDAQYEMSELASRFDWGHCSPNIGVDLALREGIRRLVFTHHDPWASAAKIERMYEQAKRHMQGQLTLHGKTWEKLGQPNGPILYPAHDGLKIVLD